MKEITSEQQILNDAYELASSLSTKAQNKILFAIVNCSGVYDPNLEKDINDNKFEEIIENIERQNIDKSSEAAKKRENIIEILRLFEKKRLDDHEQTKKNIIVASAILIFVASVSSIIYSKVFLSSIINTTIPESTISAIFEVFSAVYKDILLRTGAYIEYFKFSSSGAGAADGAILGLPYVMSDIRAIIHNSILSQQFWSLSIPLSLSAFSAIATTPLLFIDSAARALNSVTDQFKSLSENETKIEEVKNDLLLAYKLVSNDEKLDSEGKVLLPDTRKL